MSGMETRHTGMGKFGGAMVLSGMETRHTGMGKFGGANIFVGYGNPTYGNGKNLVGRVSIPDMIQFRFNGFPYPPMPKTDHGVSIPDNDQCPMTNDE